MVNFSRVVIKNAQNVSFMVLGLPMALEYQEVIINVFFVGIRSFLWF